MGGADDPDRPGGPLPIRLASRALARVFMNPGGDPGRGAPARSRGGEGGVDHRRVLWDRGRRPRCDWGRPARGSCWSPAPVRGLRGSPRRSRSWEARPSAHPCDLADPDAVEELAADLLDEYGRVDVLISNAGKSIRRSIELSYERFHDFQRTIDINYLGPVRLVLALLPSMRERHEGHIVNVSTMGVRIPQPPAGPRTCPPRPPSTFGCDASPRRCARTVSPAHRSTWHSFTPG